MRHHLIRILAFFSILTALLVPAIRANAISFCSDQFGTANFDEATAMATDGSNIWVGGDTFGSMNGSPNKGGNDAYVREYDNTCAVVWTSEFGTAGGDYARGLGADGSGNVYVGGIAAGKIPGGASYGGNDAYVRSYDSGGNVRWTKEFGTSGDDRLNGVVVAGSRVYVTGATSGTFPGQKKAGHTDAFIAAFKTSGKMLWLHQFGTTSYDAGYSVAAYQSNLFIAGGTDGAFKNQTHAGQSDGFLREYSTAGVKGFTQEFGTTEDDGIGGIVADASGEVIAGTTEGAFPTYTHQGMQDGYVKAFHTDGSDDWTYQFGTTAQDLVKAITLRGSSQIVIGGDSFGGIGEGSVPSSNDVFVAFIDRSGSPGSFLAIGFGSPDDGIDTGNAIVSNSDGVQLAGGTTGQLEGSNLGSEDAYYTHICFC